ncbi:MAG: Bcr/CflA family drug resistance efflux transporter, partial [Proteobacteria bacterium]|nr:Bcr/CflA family drug resistance efflux transporter [Pseudomonadota bacterium]
GFLQMAIAAGFSWLVGALLAETALPLALVMATAAALAPAAYLLGVRALGAAGR